MQKANIAAPVMKEIIKIYMKQILFILIAKNFELYQLLSLTSATLLCYITLYKV